jgi:uncharacterized repeat protein (TIGR01451 family)
MKNHLRLFVSLLSACIMFFGVSMPVLARPAQQANCVITGTVYRDFNASGARDALEPPVAGIVVTAYNQAGGTIQAVTTNAQGQYTLNQLPDAAEVRIEFTGLPSFLRYGPDGTGSYTSVVFVTCGQNPGVVDLAVANPGQHCVPDVEVATTCFRLGDANTGPNAGESVLLSIPYTAGSTDLTSLPVGGRFDGSNTVLAGTDDIGAVYGLAYQRQSATLFAGAFLKRHTDFGSNGPGAIYAINTTTGAISPFTTLTAANAGEALHTNGTPYADRPAEDPWLIDSEAFTLVGKRGLGEMTMSDDDTTLWVVNLFDRRLYSIPVNNPGGATSFAIPTSLPNCPATGDARPFAVTYEDGLVYVGVTCTAESTQNRAQMRAYVYSFNPSGGGFSLVLDFPLAYERRCADDAANPACVTDFPADWRPWTDDFRTDFAVVDGGLTYITYPQPWLTDIAFDNNGDMILALRDRNADQMGNAAYSTFSGDLANYIAIGPGDLLRACRNGGGWTLESNGSCGGVTTGGSANVGQGPGSPGGEYYFEDNLVDFHDEDGMGAIFQMPGQPYVMGTFFDPIPINSELADGGFRWLDNQTGQTTRAYRVFNGTLGDIATFAKANGLGGIEAFCPPAPIEIGNRVWYDIDNDGIQDPGEPYGAGVTVNLYDTNGNLIASTITNAQGEYLFTSLNDGVQFNTDYVIRLDNPADYAPGGPLFEWFLTRNNAGADLRDSDAILASGFPTITMRTGGPGDNDHTFDFGFSRLQNICCDDDDGDDDDGGSGEFGVSDDLYIDKSLDQPFGQPGDVVTWTIRVWHTRGDAIPSVTVQDAMPRGLEILSATATAGNVSVSGQNITIVISPLNPGQTVTITIRTRISSNPDSLILDNTVFADGASDTARLVIAGELVRTGETPWWRTPLILLGAGLVLSGAGYAARRRYTA